MLKDNLKFLIENKEDYIELDDGRTVVKIGDIKINVLEDGKLEYKVDVFYSLFRAVQLVTLEVNDTEDIWTTINDVITHIMLNVDYTMNDISMEETRENIKAIKNGLIDIKDNIEKLKENINRLYE